LGINIKKGMGQIKLHPEINPAILTSQNSVNKHFHYKKLLINFSIYIISFLIFYLIKKQSFVYDETYAIFLPAFIVAWGAGSFLSGKFQLKRDSLLLSKLKRYYVSHLISLGIVAVLSYQTGFSGSRFIVLGSLFGAAIIEGFIAMLQSRFRFEMPEKEKRQVSYMLLFIDFVIITWIFFFLYKIKIGFAHFNEDHLLLILCTYICWLFAALMTHQFKLVNKEFNIWKALGTQIKFYILILALSAFIIYFLQLPEFYRSLYMTGVVIYTFWSFVISLFFYIDKLPQKTDEIRSEFLHAYELKQTEFDPKVEPVEIKKYKLNGIVPPESKLKTKLEFIYFKEYPEIFSLLETKLDLSTFNINRTFVLRSPDPYNVTTFPENHLELFINLHQLNDVRWINEYFIKINKRLVSGGVLVCNFEPIRYRYKRFLKRYPFIIAYPLYLIDFIWYRMAPKIPVLQRIYFAFTKGKNRALSLAEGLGRLYYCGFELLDLKDLDNRCYVIARKVKEPSTDQNPSYSTILKMKRIGKYGKPIYVYKLRTMHPYSEYLQAFVYQQNKLEIGGKFKNDFRITTWGSIFRRLWIDELPMLVNLLKGDCKLVGVRPISKQYFDLYDNEFRERRIKYKPGLIPPFYADMPSTILEILKSEETYLNSFDKNRIKTDFVYFWKSFNNIIINNKRSS
jgi:hypothetical protein